MSVELFSLRPAREEDMPYIDSYAYREGMDRIPGIDGVTVAVNADDLPVGFLRLAIGPDGVAYVNPVVTLDSWRGYGVGKALMRMVMDAHDEVRLVARGGSVPFYRAIGFEETPWENIDVTFTEDCDGCPLWEECNPLPMAWKA